MACSLMVRRSFVKEGMVQLTAPTSLSRAQSTGLGAGVGGHSGFPFGRRVERVDWMAVYGAPAPSHARYFISRYSSMP